MNGWTKIFAGGLAFSGLLGGMSSDCHAAAPEVGQPRLVFSIGTNSNSVFDSQTLRLIAKDANIAIISAPFAETDGAPSYAQVVSQLHALNPSLPVLVYFWATRTYLGNTYSGALRSGNLINGKLSSTPSFLLKNPITGKVVHGERVWYADVASSAYRHWLIQRVVSVLKETGTDGVASDMSVRYPFPKWCDVRPEFCKRYAAGVDSLLAELRDEIKPKLLLFNGLWTTRPGFLREQEDLLNYTDGAEIEFFGRQENKPIPPFSIGILPYLKVIKSNPDKHILVFGRGATSYTSYREDFHWERYLYAAYLMAADRNTSFRYASSFQVVAPGRANPFVIYQNMATRLGLPNGPYHVKGDLYYRKFTKGIALLVPAKARPAKFSLPTAMYSSDRKLYKGDVMIGSGTGLVLFKAQPAVRKFLVSYEGDQSSRLVFPDSHIVKPPKGAAYLHMDSVPSARDWEHDMMLDPVKNRSPSLDLVIRMRTRDPSAKLYVVAEVDDKQRRAEQAVTVLSASTCEAEKKHNMHITFRIPHSRAAYPHGCKAHFLNTDGHWHDYRIPTNGVLPDRFTLRRWEYVRFKGDVDLASVIQPGFF